jgi:hypothetical protein
MDIDGLFFSPSDHLAAFSNIQSLLYRQDPAFHDYFQPLQMDLLTSPRASLADRRIPTKLFTSSLRAVDKTLARGNQRSIKTDVLICPNQHFGRKTETEFFVRTVLGVAETGARILCLIPTDASCQPSLNRQLEAAGRRGQVEFLDPAVASSRVEKRLRWKLAQERGHAAFAEAVKILRPYGLSLGEELKREFERRAYAVESWERLEPMIEFDAAVLRCHWFEFATSICRTAKRRGKPVVTFQQGVIGHTLDVPVTATKYVAFGECSASFLSKVNRRFFQSVGEEEQSVEYVKGGCLVDDILELPKQFELRSVLFVDVPTAQSSFYGVESQASALLQLAQKLLSADLPLRRVVIRPHPFWVDVDFEECKRLVSEHPSRCELSHPAWSLEDDLRRASAVVGIFSGVLTVASASGLPTIFLQTEGGYTTGDLECFSPAQTLQPDSAFCKLSRILTDPSEYAAAQSQAYRNARAYYANGKTVNLSGKFFEDLLWSARASATSKDMAG